MKKPFISVIIVSWNTKDITDHCLACMKKAVEYVKNKAVVEVIVVENDSNDGSPEMIAKKHPWVKLIKSGSDLGFAKGNNFGVKRADPDSNYLLLLNNDAYVRDDTLAKSLEFMSKHPECDLFGCRLQFLDGRFQPSAGYLPTPGSVWAWMWGLDRLPLLRNYLSPVHPKNEEFFKVDREVGWVMGAFLFMKRPVFEKTHGFDESFFMYMEEVEWCRRVIESGFHIWYTPKFNITHVDKASSFGDPEKLARVYQLEILGLIYYLRKHYNNQCWWLIPVIKIGLAGRWFVFTLLGNKMRQSAYRKIFTQS